MVVNVRPATLIDLDLIEKWGRALYEVERDFESHMVYSGKHFKERDVQRLTSPDALYLIAEVQDRPVGYLAAFVEPLPTYLSLPGSEGVIEVVYVETSFRGKGVASRLIEVGLSRLREVGVKRVRAGIYAQNEASLKLFQKFGLRPYHVTVLTSFGRG